MTTDGKVIAWGNNQDGQCDVLEGLDHVKAIAARGNYNLALKDDGTVVGWGQFHAPEGLDHVAAIAARWAHSLALKEDGTLVKGGEPIVFLLI